VSRCHRNFRYYLIIKSRQMSADLENCQQTMAPYQGKCPPMTSTTEVDVSAIFPEVVDIVTAPEQYWRH